jgi:hypothetical protein
MHNPTAALGQARFCNEARSIITVGTVQKGSSKQSALYMQEIVEWALLDAIPHSFRYEVHLTEKNYLQTTEGSHVRANVITWKICLL